MEFFCFSIVFKREKIDLIITGFQSGLNIFIGSESSDAAVFFAMNVTSKGITVFLYQEKIYFKNRLESTSFAIILNINRLLFV